MPEAEELHIVVLDEADGTEVVQLRLAEAQGAEVVDLRIDLLIHLRGEDDALVPAAEVVFAHEVGVLVEDHLVHVELVQVGVQEGEDDGIEFHSVLLC